MNADKIKYWLNYQKIYFDVTESTNMKRKFVVRSSKDSTDKMLFPEKWERKAVHEFLARVSVTEDYKLPPTKNERDMLKNFRRLR